VLEGVGGAGELGGFLAGAEEQGFGDGEFLEAGV
jgi:hypothetical protein